MQFRILGPLEVLEREAAQPLGGAKQRAVLAILILHRGELVSGERLADELWGERPPATAPKTLQGYISRLRKTVGETMLSTRGRGYVLTLRSGQLDLDQFEQLAAQGHDALSAGDAVTAAGRLRAALALWRGPPLADFTYEPFAQAEIARLEEARLASVEDRIEADLGLGRHGQLTGELERLVREHPARERLRGQLMLSLYRAGRQADALECYRVGRRAMVDELGIEPGRALQELEAAILRQEAALDPPVEAVASTPAVSTDGASEPRTGGIQTFMIADIRGYTRFTEEQGDHAAGLLTGRFSEVSRQVLEDSGGALVEFRGDEALAVFDSARGAIAAAVELQRRLADATFSDESLPLPVGIGLDAGEAVAIPEGYRGGALNLAARLCSMAAAGEILASREFVHVAGRIPGVIYEERGSLEVKNLSKPVDVVRIAPITDDPAERFADWSAASAEPRRLRVAIADNSVLVGDSEIPHRNAFSREAVVGRAEQLRQLRGGLDAVFTDRGVVVMIGGEAGIGKTRLADELAGDARDRGARVVWGRCWEAGGAPGYWPWVQVLRSLLDGRGNVDLRAFGGAGGSSLLALIPEQREASLALATPAAESEVARFRLFDAVAWVLRQAAATQPLVIVLDDLHAADTPSLLLLQFLAGQLGDAPVMLAGLYRDDHLSENGALSGCLASLAREQTTQRIRLTGLAEVHTAAMIDAITGRHVAASVARAIHDETEGNPLFVGEIVRLLEAEDTLERSLNEPRRGRQLPDTVREVIDQRLRRLTTGCRGLLEVASTLGREFSLKELAAVAELDDPAVLEPFDEAMTARVLTEAPTVGRLRFSHALVRDTLYETLSAGRRRAAHLRAGEILERLHASDPEPYLAELAHHFFEALPSTDAARAVGYAERAGDHAVALLAYEEAARQYALALRALDSEAGDVAEQRCGLLVSLGDAWARAGDEPAARSAFLQAAAIASNAGLPVLLAQAALGYGGRLLWSRAYDDMHLIPLLESALQALPAGASALRVRVMARLSGALRDHPSRDRRASLSSQAVEIARGLDDPATLAYALDGHYSAVLWPETAEQRLAIADEIVAFADQVADNERAAAGRLYRVIANMELGRIDEAERELDIIVEQAVRLRQPSQLWMATSSRANLALFQGRFEDARTLIEEALTLGERAQRRDAALSHRLQVFLLDRETGGNAEIEALIDEAVSAFPTRPVFRCALAYVHSQLGNASRAGAEVDDLAARDFAVIQRDNEYLFSLAFVADTVETLSDVRAAAVLYDLLVPYARLNASNADEVAIGSVSRTLGVLASVLARWDDAARHFEAATVHNQHMGARPWLAHTQHDYAKMLLARDMPGDRDRAQHLVGAAAEQYQKLGMTPWLAQASELLVQRSDNRPNDHPIEPS